MGDFMLFDEDVESGSLAEMDDMVPAPSLIP
jgi:hypothetical protein